MLRKQRDALDDQIQRLEWQLSNAPLGGWAPGAWGRMCRRPTRAVCPPEHACFGAAMLWICFADGSASWKLTPTVVRCNQKVTCRWLAHRWGSRHLHSLNGFLHGRRPS